MTAPNTARGLKTFRTLTVVHRVHFGLCVLAPMLLSLVLIPILPAEAFSAFAVALAAAMWVLVGGLGVSVGYHRYFSHRSFQAAAPFRYVLGALGSMAGQGPVGYWVALHRRHHAHSDRPGDPHSPCSEASGYSPLRAFLHGHFLWTTSTQDLLGSRRYAPDLSRDRIVIALARHYWFWVFAGLAIPSAIAGLWWGSWEGAVAGLYGGGIVRLAIGHHLIWSVNSVCHVAGARPYPRKDSSSNVWWLAIPTFGESWHNNHHHDPGSPRFGMSPFQIDIGWWFIAAFAALGLVRRRAIETSRR